MEKKCTAIVFGTVGRQGPSTSSIERNFCLLDLGQ